MAPSYVQKQPARNESSSFVLQCLHDLNADKREADGIDCGWVAEVKLARAGPSIQNLTLNPGLEGRGWTSAWVHPCRGKSTRGEVDIPDGGLASAACASVSGVGIARNLRYAASLGMASACDVDISVHGR